MTLWQAILLGVVQGLTEFLPVSSSAHLVLIPYLMNWQIPTEQNFSFGVLVQLGTLAAVIFYYRNTLWEIVVDMLGGITRKEPFKTPLSKLGWYIVLATIPAGLFGLLLKSKVEAVFNSPVITALFLFGTALLLFISEIMGKRDRTLNSLTWKDALWIGLAQALAIFPGVSRSGSTITGGMVRGLDRQGAARFSFLMSIPIMLAAGLLSILDLFAIPNLDSFLPALLAGFLTAGIVGYISIYWLMSFLNRHSLKSFAYYCIGLAILVLVFAYGNQASVLIRHIAAGGL